jgi:hypothetical protein
VDVLAIILACSLHPDDALVRTLVDVQSSGNVYFVGDLATLKTNDSLTSSAAALRFAEDLRRHGGRPAVGLLGVPLEWAGRYGRAPIELFDACTNIAVGTAALAEFHDACRGRRSVRGPRLHQVVSSRHAPGDRFAARRSCVLGRFARALGVRGEPAAILRRLAGAPSMESAEAADSPPRRSLIFRDGADGVASPSHEGEPSSVFFEPRAQHATAP